MANESLAPGRCSDVDSEWVSCVPLCFLCWKKVQNSRKEERHCAQLSDQTLASRCLSRSREVVGGNLGQAL